MSSLRQLVSTIRAEYKMISTDVLATDRMIAAEIRNCTLFLCKRETNLRRLWATDTLFTTIPCLILKEVSISECCEYVDSCNIARSVYKLPRISEGNYQYVIQGVYSINAMGGKGKKIKEISINRYINLLKLPIIRKEEYFWISNGYLYVTNPLLKAIRMAAFFEVDVPNEIMFPECGCGTPKYTDEEWCKNPLDKEFALPGYLEKQVLELTAQKLQSTYYRTKADISSEGVDTNQSLGLPPRQNYNRTQ